MLRFAFDNHRQSFLERSFKAFEKRTFADGHLTTNPHKVNIKAMGAGEDQRTRRLFSSEKGRMM